MAKSKTSGQGRPKGVPNKATSEIKALAQAYGPDAIAKLWSLAESADGDSAKVSAIKELLDRGYGKSPQAVDLGVSGKVTIGWES